MIGVVCNFLPFPQIHHQILREAITVLDLGLILGTSEVLDVSRRSRTLSGGAKERRLKRTNSTLQGEATEGNAADDILMVDQDFPGSTLLSRNMG